MLPEKDVVAIRQYVAAKNAEIPEEARTELLVELEFDALAATICDAHNYEPDNKNGWIRMSVARLRYTAARDEWSLYWMRGNLKWTRYDLDATPDVDVLLAEIENDPYGCFWG